MFKQVLLYSDPGVYFLVSTRAVKARVEWQVSLIEVLEAITLSGLHSMMKCFFASVWV